MRSMAGAKESATVAQCWRAAMLLVGMLEEGIPASASRMRKVALPADAGARERWRARYMGAVERMRQAGIKTIADHAA